MATMQGGDAVPTEMSAVVDVSDEDAAVKAVITPPPVPPVPATASRKNAARHLRAAAAAPVAVQAAPVAPTITHTPGPVMPDMVMPAMEKPAAVAGPATIKPEVRDSMDKMMKTAEDFVTFGQGNVEAMMRSGQIWATGVQDLGKQFAATAQAHFDETVSTFKAMTSVKSLKEAMDLQSSFARASLDKTVTETGRMTDASLKLAEQALAPITARVTLAVEKFSRTV